MSWREVTYRLQPLTMRLRLLRKIEVCSDPKQVTGAMQSALDDGQHLVVGRVLPDRSATEIWARRW